MLSRDEWRWPLTIVLEQFRNPTSGAAMRWGQMDQATDDLAIKVDVIAATSKLEEAVGHAAGAQHGCENPALPVEGG